MDVVILAILKAVRRRLKADGLLTVRAISEELGLSRQYISGRFRRKTGVLLSHYLKRRRLQKAAMLLLTNSELSVSDVRESCGFGGANYFRQEFRAWFGVSPARFRRDRKMRLRDAYMMARAKNRSEGVIRRRH